MPENGAVLLRRYLPWQMPDICMQMIGDRRTLEDRANVTAELAVVLRNLYTTAWRIHATGQTITALMREDACGGVVGQQCAAALVGALQAVSRVSFTYAQLTASIQEIMGMEQYLVEEFVPPRYKHQYTPDGRMHMSDPLELLMIACYPNNEYRGETVRTLNMDYRIAPMRSWRAFFRLIAAAWFLGQMDRIAYRDTRIEHTVAYLEEFLFATPGEVNERWKDTWQRPRAPEYHIEVDPPQGCTFRRFVSSPNKHTVTHEQMPRYVRVEQGGAVHYVPIWQVARPKNTAGEFRKAVLGREQHDTIGARLAIRNREDYELQKARFHNMIYRFGKPDDDFVKAQSSQKTSNLTSIHDKGVLWQGNVVLGGVPAEVQVVLFKTDWDRQYSLTPSVHTWYKERQWLIEPTWSSENPDPDPAHPLPPIIQLVFPPALFPEWGTWAGVLESHRYRMLQLAGAVYGQNEAVHEEAVAWVQSSVRHMRHQPWSLKL